MARKAKKRKCYLCDKEVPKGRFYITTALPGSTMRINGLRLCKDHARILKDGVWDVIIRFLRNEPLWKPRIAFKQEGDMLVAVINEDDDTVQELLGMHDGAFQEEDRPPVD